MIIAIWCVLAALLALMVAGWLVLLGVVRALDDIQGRNAPYPRILQQGLDVGSIAPAFNGSTVDGGSFSSENIGGGSMLLVFVHPGCAPCEVLVPQVFMVFAAFQLPGTTVLVSRGRPEDQPHGWRRSLRANGAELEIVLEKEDEISKAFRVDARPFAYLIGRDRKIDAARVINDANEVLALIRKDSRPEKATSTVGES